MEAQIKLGRIFGVQLGLHYSWLIIALLVTLSLVGQFYAINSQWGTGVIWAKRSSYIRRGASPLSALR